MMVRGGLASEDGCVCVWGGGDSKNVNLLTRAITESCTQHLVVVIIYTFKQKDYY